MSSFQDTPKSLSSAAKLLLKSYLTDHPSGRSVGDCRNFWNEKETSYRGTFHETKQLLLEIDGVEGELHKGVFWVRLKQFAKTHPWCWASSIQKAEPMENSNEIEESHDQDRSSANVKRGNSNKIEESDDQEGSSANVKKRFWLCPDCGRNVSGAKCFCETLSAAMRARDLAVSKLRSKPNQSGILPEKVKRIHQEPKTKWHCPNCRRYVPVTAKECIFCKQIRAKYRPCPNCRRYVPATAKECICEQRAKRGQQERKKYWPCPNCDRYVPVTAEECICEQRAKRAKRQDISEYGNEACPPVEQQISGGFPPESLAVQGEGWECPKCGRRVPPDAPWCFCEADERIADESKLRIAAARLTAATRPTLLQNPSAIISSAPAEETQPNVHVTANERLLNSVGLPLAEEDKVARHWWLCTKCNKYVPDKQPTCVCEMSPEQWHEFLRKLQRKRKWFCTKCNSGVPMRFSTCKCERLDDTGVQDKRARQDISGYGNEACPPVEQQNSGGFPPNSGAVQEEGWECPKCGRRVPPDAPWCFCEADERIADESKLRIAAARLTAATRPTLLQTPSAKILSAPAETQPSGHVIATESQPGTPISVGLPLAEKEKVTHHWLCPKCKNYVPNKHPTCLCELSPDKRHQLLRRKWRKRNPWRVVAISKFLHKFLSKSEPNNRQGRTLASCCAFVNEVANLKRLVEVEELHKMLTFNEKIELKGSGVQVWVRLKAFSHLGWCNDFLREESSYLGRGQPSSKTAIVSPAPEPDSTTAGISHGLRPESNPQMEESPNQALMPMARPLWAPPMMDNPSPAQVSMAKPPFVSPMAPPVMTNPNQGQMQMFKPPWAPVMGNTPIPAPIWMMDNPIPGQVSMAKPPFVPPLASPVMTNPNQGQMRMSKPPWAPVMMADPNPAPISMAKPPFVPPMAPPVMTNPNQAQMQMATPPWGSSMMGNTSQVPMANPPWAGTSPPQSIPSLPKAVPPVMPPAMPTQMMAHIDSSQSGYPLGNNGSEPEQEPTDGAVMVVEDMQNLWDQIYGND